MGLGRGGRARPHSAVCGGGGVGTHSGDLEPVVHRLVDHVARVFRVLFRTTEPLYLDVLAAEVGLRVVEAVQRALAGFRGGVRGFVPVWGYAG